MTALQLNSMFAGCGIPQLKKNGLKLEDELSNHLRSIHRAHTQHGRRETTKIYFTSDTDYIHSLPFREQVTLARGIIQYAEQIHNCRAILTEPPDSSGHFEIRAEIAKKFKPGENEFIDKNGEMLVEYYMQRCQKQTHMPGAIMPLGIDHSVTQLREVQKFLENVNSKVISYYRLRPIGVELIIFPTFDN